MNRFASSKEAPISRSLIGEHEIPTNILGMMPDDATREIAVVRMAEQPDGQFAQMWAGDLCDRDLLISEMVGHFDDTGRAAGAVAVAGYLVLEAERQKVGRIEGALMGIELFLQRSVRPSVRRFVESRQKIEQ